MRERLDCAILNTLCTDRWVSNWLDTHAGGRLHVQPLAPSIDIAQPDSPHQLLESSMLLRRFDVCLLPVSEHNLAWLRTSLSAARGSLQTPMLALVYQLKAAALNDLYGLGISDFVRDPLCTEELRVRIERLLHRRRYRATDTAFAAHGPALLNETSPPDAPVSARLYDLPGESDYCSTILERTGLELDAYAAASASRCATSKESFRAAKSKVIERFERAYIAAALGRHSGNIAMAARTAQKHRRAFWALMRKYQIDAAPYRSEAPPNYSRAGKITRAY